MRGLRKWTSAVIAATASASMAVAFDAGPAAADPPGTLISAEPQSDAFHGIPGGSVVRYWMASSNGAPKQASGALFVPAGPAPENGWPIVAFDHGTTGLGMGCGGKSDPSTAPYDHFIADEDTIMRSLVSQGYAVVAPDYLGLGLYDTGPHPYLELQSEATATIDMVRAARAARPELSGTWAVLGLSQGGQAALATSHLQAIYSPDLDFRGTVAIDPESDVEKALTIAGPTTPAIPGTAETVGYLTDILAGLRAARPDAAVDSYLTPLGHSVLDRIGTMCQPQINATISDLGIGQLLSRPLADGPLIGAVNSYMAVPTTGYNRPILLLLNATDTSVPSPLHAALAAQFAANGVDFRSVVGTGGHTQLNPQMWSALDDFLAARVRS
ncbi:lipase family protein [Nocardia sp. NBC_01327]|uniref:lipase family protein n=1 Tax=Nocardia sp. NBC_01327 TaxID=2903593 RepID=UPI002E110891|nr:lipase family protein [Nocardia sp. NBC_01327]